jgi:hypothetical protein
MPLKYNLIMLLFLKGWNIVKFDGFSELTVLSLDLV